MLLRCFRGVFLVLLGRSSGGCGQDLGADFAHNGVAFKGSPATSELPMRRETGRLGSVGGRFALRPHALSTMRGPGRKWLYNEGMARLIRMHVTNYRSIGAQSVELLFPSNTPVVLIGENNAGKSNLVRALHLALGSIWPGTHEPEDNEFYLRNRAAPIEVLLEFAESPARTSFLDTHSAGSVIALGVSGCGACGKKGLRPVRRRELAGVRACRLAHSAARRGIERARPRTRRGCACGFEISRMRGPGGFSRVRMRVRRRKHIAFHSGPAPTPAGLTERWSMDIVHDALTDGRQFRALMAT